MKKQWKRAAALILVFTVMFTMWRIQSTQSMKAQESGNLILSEDFEGSTYEFMGRGITMEVTDDEFHGGTKSAYASGRTDSWQGINADMTSILKSGNIYYISAWVMSKENSHIVMSFATETASGTEYPWVGNKVTEAGEWMQVSGTYMVPDGVDKLELNIETYGDGNETKSFYVDDIQVWQELTYFEKTFEEGKDDIQIRGTANITLSADYYYDGAQSLAVLERGDQQWHGASLDITKYIKAGGTYAFEFWVYTPIETEFKTSVTKVVNGVQGWDDLKTPTIQAHTWTKVEAEYTVLPDTSKLEWNFETTDNGIGKSFYLDGMKLSAKDIESYVEQATEAEPEVDKMLTPLKEVYENDFLIGSIYNPWVQEGLNKEILLHHFNAVTPENLMKPESMQYTEGNFNFSESDSMINFAKENGLSVIGHTFVWHSQSPDWMAKGLTRDEAMSNMREHIKTIGERYDDDILSWDVVNEAIADGVSLPADGDWRKCLRPAPWKTAIGDDYIALAFQYAREAAPNAKLYYNDYNLNNPQKAEIVAAMVSDLRNQGIPVDGIGMQAHYNTNLSIDAVRNSIELFKATGAEISITELDVTVTDASPSGLTYDQEVAQAQVHAQLFQLYKEYSESIERVTFWGYTDDQSWRSDQFPCLFNGNYSAKESYYAVLDPDAYLSEHPIEGIPEPKQLKATAGTPVIDGMVEDIWDNVEVGNVNIMSTAHNGATAKVKALWDANNIYVLMDVTDALLNASSTEVYNQDSVEIFLDENNAKTAYYEADDGQFRVSFENNVSYGSNGIKEGFQSAVQLTAKGYIVEMKIPTNIGLEQGMILGFEAQVNDSNAAGERFSIAKFNDDTDNSWQSTDRWGELVLE